MTKNNHSRIYESVAALTVRWSVLPFVATALSLTFFLSGCAALQDTAEVDEPVAVEEPVDPDFQDYTQDLPDTDVTIDMVAVPGGTFMMGRDPGEDGYQSHEGPQREVRIDPFWMSSHEITWEQFDLFAREVIEDELDSDLMAHFGIETDAITAPSPTYGDETFGMGRDGRPAISMTHYAAIIYSMWLTVQTGEFHRLPTEAEWEFACRGGAADSYSLGGDPDLLEDYEWHRGNSDGSYNQVALKNPNPLGLYDMKGNVAEWVMDEFHEDYHERLSDNEVNDNPWFRPDVLYPRSVRGGSYRDEPSMIRCTQRRGSDARWSRGDPQIPKSVWWHTDVNYVGFRVVRPKEAPPLEVIEEFWIEPMLDF